MKSESLRNFSNSSGDDLIDLVEHESGSAWSVRSSRCGPRCVGQCKCELCLCPLQLWMSSVAACPKKKECLLWFSPILLCSSASERGGQTNDLSTLHVLFIRVESHENYTEWNCAVFFSRGTFTSCHHSATSCLEKKSVFKTEKDWKSQRLMTVLCKMKDLQEKHFWLFFSFLKLFDLIVLSLLMLTLFILILCVKGFFKLYNDKATDLYIHNQTRDRKWLNYNTVCGDLLWRPSCNLFFSKKKRSSSIWIFSSVTIFCLNITSFLH